MTRLRFRRPSAPRLFDVFLLLLWFGVGLSQGIICFAIFTRLLPGKPVKVQYDNVVVKSEPRLLCHIMTTPSKSSRAWSIWNTWGRHCDKVLFGSPSRAIDGLPTHVYRERKNSLNNQTIDWLWTKESLGEMHFQHPGFDWYLNAPDTAFVLVENLKKQLRKMKSQVPTAFGTLMVDRQFDVNYTVSGPGYVLSKEALTKTVERLYTSAACSHEEDDADIALGRCMSTAGVQFVDATDPVEGFRMFPLSTEHVSSQPLPQWLKTSLALQPENCCSADFISTADVLTDSQYEYYFLTHIVQTSNLRKY